MSVLALSSYGGAGVVTCLERLTNTFTSMCQQHRMILQLCTNSSVTTRKCNEAVKLLLYFGLGERKLIWLVPG